jgi:hypothetical protein
MWMLRNLGKYGANQDHMLEVYIQQIRSVTEMACPVWNSGLTHHDKMTLERVQKTALAIIRGDAYTTYSEALQHFEVKSLAERREALCLKFALKAYKHPKFKTWFAHNKVSVDTRSGQSQRRLKKVITRKTRYKKSPLPYLTELLNTHLSK